jgi:hypothetical protein
MPRADLIGISDAGTCVNLGTKFTLGASCNGLWCFIFLLSASVACVWTYKINKELLETEMANLVRDRIWPPICVIIMIKVIIMVYKLYVFRNK